MPRCSRNARIRSPRVSIITHPSFQREYRIPRDCMQLFCKILLHVYQLIGKIYVQHDDATGHETTHETVADREGKQGYDPDRVSAKASSVILATNTTGV